MSWLEVKARLWPALDKCYLWQFSICILTEIFVYQNIGNVCINVKNICILLYMHVLIHLYIDLYIDVQCVYVLILYTVQYLKTIM